MADQEERQTFWSAGTDFNLNVESPEGVETSPDSLGMTDVVEDDETIQENDAEAPVERLDSAAVEFEK